MLKTGKYELIWNWKTENCVASDNCIHMDMKNWIFPLPNNVVAAHPWIHGFHGWSEILCMQEIWQGRTKISFHMSLNIYIYQKQPHRDVGNLIVGLATPCVLGNPVRTWQHHAYLVLKIGKIVTKSKPHVYLVIALGVDHVSCTNLYSGDQKCIHDHL